jgi:hypothetical protein
LAVKILSGTSVIHLALNGEILLDLLEGGSTFYGTESSDSQCTSGVDEAAGAQAANIKVVANNTVRSNINFLVISFIS